MKTLKMFATTTFLIAGILMNQAFAQNAQSATKSPQKAAKTEMNSSKANVAATGDQKAGEVKKTGEAKVAANEVKTAKTVEKTMTNGTANAKSEAVTMHNESSPKHHKGHKSVNHAGTTVNKTPNETGNTAKPVAKPKAQ